MLNLNIITQLLGFFVLAVAVNRLNIKVLMVILLIFLAFNMLSKTSQFLRALKRFKWFFLVMMLIFAFNTPGEHLANWPFAISPTYEGLVSGAAQTLRIAVMLAALALILALNTRQQLISGFYFIFSPLKYLGLEVERFAARLWLTLHYVELQREQFSSKDLLGRLSEMANLQLNQSHENVSIEFMLPKFSLADVAVIALLLVLVLFKVAF